VFIKHIPCVQFQARRYSVLLAFSANSVLVTLHTLRWALTWFLWCPPGDSGQWVSGVYPGPSVVTSSPCLVPFPTLSPFHRPQRLTHKLLSTPQVTTSSLPDTLLPKPTVVSSLLLAKDAGASHSSIGVLLLITIINKHRKTMVPIGKWQLSRFALSHLVTTGHMWPSGPCSVASLNQEC
jgi:hypothetical protein